MHSHARKPRAQNMQIVFQDPFASLSPRQIGDIVAEGLDLPRTLQLKNAAACQTSLVEVGLDVDAASVSPSFQVGNVRESRSRALIWNHACWYWTNLRLRWIVPCKPDCGAVTRLQARHNLTYVFITTTCAL